MLVVFALAVVLTPTALGTHPRPGGGSPFRFPLVPAFQACTAPNVSHVAPYAYPSCAPVSLVSPLLLMGTAGAGKWVGADRRPLHRRAAGVQLMRSR